MILSLLLQSLSLAKNKTKKVDEVDLEPEISDNLSIGWWKSDIPEDYETNIEYGPKIRIMLSIIEYCERIGEKVLVCFLNLFSEKDVKNLNLKDYDFYK